MKNKKIIYGVMAILVASNILLCLSAFSKSGSKMGYVEIGVVYDKFMMTEEYDKEFFTSESRKAYEIDSLKLQLQGLEKTYSTANSADKPMIKQQYDELFLKVREMDEVYKNSNEMLKQQMNTEIFNQINEYMKEFGKEKGYTIIWGANGNGNIMYGSDEKNITDDVVEYINKRYSDEH